MALTGLAYPSSQMLLCVNLSVTERNTSVCLTSYCPCVWLVQWVMQWQSLTFFSIFVFLCFNSPGGWCAAACFPSVSGFKLLALGCCLLWGCLHAHCWPLWRMAWSCAENLPPCTHYPTLSSQRQGSAQPRAWGCTRWAGMAQVLFNGF